MRLQRSILFQPLLPPSLRSDADRCARKIKATCVRLARYHLMGMANKHAFGHARATTADFSAAEARGKIIDQDGREIPRGPLRPQFGGGLHFDSRHSTV